MPHSAHASIVEIRYALSAGKVKAGFTSRTRRLLADYLSLSVIAKCPFGELEIVKSSYWSGGVTEEDLAVVKWVKPKMVVQVAFVEWSKDKLLRHSKFIGVREDRSPREIVRDGKQ